MKKRYVKVMFLSMTLLVISTTATYAVQPKDDQKESAQTPVDGNLPLLIINGTNESSSFNVSSDALLGKEIKITAPNGFTVTPTVIPANSKKWRYTFVRGGKGIRHRAPRKRHFQIARI